MPYSTNADLPKAVRQTVPEEKQSKFRQVFNSVMEDTGSEQRAFQAAWSSVEKVQMSTLAEKAKNWNARHGAKKGRITAKTLRAVYDRGIGAYKTNPGSVRPNVTSKEQWAMARVNSFLKIAAGQKAASHDKDLLPGRTEKAEYRGEKVALDKPFRLPKGSAKKFGVYVKSGDKVKRVTFGSPTMEIRRDDPKARANFRARHNCEGKTDKTTAGYWSCRMWEPGVSVSDMLAKDEKDFSPHMMYDPKTGKGKKADTYEEHLRLSEMGYVHKSDEEQANLEGQIVKTDDEQRLVYGWASVITEDGTPLVDRQGDVIEADTMVKAVNKFMEHIRVGKMMHKGDQVGQVVHSMPLTKEIGEALGISSSREGWIVALKVFDDEVWSLVKSGQLTAFSIGGKAKRKEVND